MEDTMRKFGAAAFATAALLTASASSSFTGGSHQNATAAPVQKPANNDTHGGFPVCAPRLVKMNDILGQEPMHILHIDCN
jgi:hypothetical protein